MFGEVWLPRLFIISRRSSAEEPQALRDTEYDIAVFYLPHRAARDGNLKPRAALLFVPQAAHFHVLTKRKLHQRAFETLLGGGYHEAVQQHGSRLLHAGREFLVSPDEQLEIRGYDLAVPVKVKLGGIRYFLGYLFLELVSRLALHEHVVVLRGNVYESAYDFRLCRRNSV